MSELVEKVARAICLNRAAPACDCKRGGVCKAPSETLLAEFNERPSQSRAAIAAVAEWLAQSEDRECYPLQALAAALRAAAGSAIEAKP